MPGFLFPLPAYLDGTITPAAYNDWVRVKAWGLFKRDKKRNLPVALTSTVVAYKNAVAGAAAASGAVDPFTGDALRWDQISTWDPAQAKRDPDYASQFYFMPTIDHVDPYANELCFEICSWQVNSCKSFLNPREFIAQCTAIVAYRGKPTRGKKGAVQFPAKYLLPDFLQGICTLETYSKWLLARAKELHKRDLKMGRPCATGSSRSQYRQAIHGAVCACGLCDPYTGERMSWEKIGTWDATKGNDDHDIFVKEFTLLPTVDHIDPAAKDLCFEICSWRINCCKSGRTPEDFVALCAKVAQYASTAAGAH